MCSADGNTIVQDDDQRNIGFCPANGTNALRNRAAEIESEMDGMLADDKIPVALVFQQTRSRNKCLLV